MSSFLLPVSAITLLLLFLSPAPTNADVILDVNGVPVQNRGNYYIVHPSGGLTATPGDNNSSCPLDITLEADTLGSPIRIATLYLIPILTSSFPIEFYFDNFPTTCNDPLRWWVTPKNSNGESYVIVGTPGPFKPTYFFKIVEAEKGKYVYNIKFCHVLEFTSFGRLTNTVVDEECNDVGLLNGRLGITPNKPFPVVFKKFVPKLAS